MMRNRKAQITALLSNPFILGALIIIAIAFFATSGLLAIFSSFEWNGFSFTDKEEGISQSCNLNNFASSSLAKEGEFLVLQASQSKNSVERSIETDLSGADSIIVMYDGNAYASCGGTHGTFPSAGATISIVGSEGGSVSDGFRASPIKNGESCENARPGSLTVEPALSEFKNNFDGTWSSIQSLGRDDLFVRRETSEIRGNPRLQIKAYANGGCEGSTYSLSSNSKVRIYNIIRKENGFAVCKADQFAQDLNQDGKIQQGECLDLETLLLQHEEAFQESQSEKLARLEQEQQAKIDGLIKQIGELQKAQQDTSSLKSELDEAKQRLADIEAKDGNVIAIIGGEEAFNEPGAVKGFFNRIIAWIKGWFG